MHTTIRPSPLSLGFIGGGHNSAVGTTHFVAAQMDHLFRVEAGCFSRHDDVNRATGAQWGVDRSRVYSSAEEFLEREQGRLDAVAILTPTTVHQQPVLDALSKKFAVICEKSLATTSADARKLQAAVTASAGFLAVTYNYTGYPMVRELRRMIGEGRLGKIRHIQVEMPQEGFIKTDKNGKPIVPQDWRLHDGPIPTIGLDLGVHLLHMVDFLTGQKPVEVIADQGSHGHFRDVIDNVTCLVRYSGGIDCGMWFSKSALGHRNGLRVRIYGDMGSAEWFQLDPELVLLHDRQGTRRVIDRAAAEVTVSSQARYNRFKVGHPIGFMESFANLYADIAHALAAFRDTGGFQSEFVFGPKQAIEGLTTLEAMVRSVAERTWVKVPALD